jgi:hypothetical protein
VFCFDDWFVSALDDKPLSGIEDSDDLPCRVEVKCADVDSVAQEIAGYSVFGFGRHESL